MKLYHITLPERKAHSNSHLCCFSFFVCLSRLLIYFTRLFIVFIFFSFLHPFQEKKSFFLRCSCTIVVLLSFVLCVLRTWRLKPPTPKNYIVENNKLCSWRCGGGRTKKLFLLPCLCVFFFLKSQHAKLGSCCPPPFLRRKTGGNQFKLVKSGAHITYKKIPHTHSIHSRRHNGEKHFLYKKKEKKSSKKKSKLSPSQKRTNCFAPFSAVGKKLETRFCVLVLLLLLFHTKWTLYNSANNVSIKGEEEQKKVMSYR